MIALDTNVLLRYLIQDDAVQAAAATSFLEGKLSTTTPGFISLVVICEIVWALRKTYDQPRATIAQSLDVLIKAPQFVVEDIEIVELAISADGGDIADAIIHFVGAKQGCSKTVTFDKKFARLSGVELLQ